MAQYAANPLGQGSRRFSQRLGHVSCGSCQGRCGYADQPVPVEAPGARRLRPIIYEPKGIAFADGLALGREILAKANRPTAIQCITDDLAAGLMAATHERRLVMPEALSIAGFDNFGLAPRLFPALSTATLPLMRMAEAATHQVLDTLDGRNVKPLHHFSCDVVLRDSIGAVQSK